MFISRLERTSRQGGGWDSMCYFYQLVTFFTFLKCTPGGGVLQKSDWGGVKKFPGVHEPPPGGCRNIPAWLTLYSPENVGY